MFHLGEQGQKQEGDAAHARLGGVDRQRVCQGAHTYAPLGETMYSAAEAIPGEGVSKPRSRLWTVVSAMAVLLIAGGAGVAWFLGGSSQGALSPPDGPWPEQRRFMVLQCSVEGLTPKTQPAVEKLLRSVPEIESLTAYSKRQAEGAPPEMSNVCGVQAHFVGMAREASDIPKISKELAKSPVPVNLVRIPYNFWTGKADVQVVLTVAGSPIFEVENVEARIATEKDREVIVEKILQLVDVDKIYYEDSAFATKVLTSYCPDGLCSFTPGPVDQEAIYVKTDSPGAVETLKKALDHTPGVDYVFPVW
ncbi:hypothetical protein [Planomonospora sp. ID82291]|uniref:hypothetical protein n=1 Tax=Planomonospora sp. ID82291 TaxID=2738136 RepID=UPI0018C447C0|nr:hypothetical protein [Planomonospora sp. ID82291]MBG0819100.1 hypothetical protein [Planomonospora sp. ID82291]